MLARALTLFLRVRPMPVGGPVAASSAVASSTTTLVVGSSSFMAASLSEKLSVAWCFGVLLGDWCSTMSASPELDISDGLPVWTPLSLLSEVRFNSPDRESGLLLLPVLPEPVDRRLPGNSRLGCDDFVDSESRDLGLKALKATFCALHIQERKIF